MSRPRAPRRVLALALAAVLVAGSAGAAFGYWVSAATATATLTTASVAVSQAGFGATGATYRNDVLTSTGSFTVTNTGQTAGSVSLTITATSGATMAARLPIRVWAVASAAACTPATAVPAAASSGTWASWQVSGIPLAPGASGVWCVRTTVANPQDLAAASGSQSTGSSLTVVLDDAAGWVGTVSATDSVTRTTELIFPTVDPGTFAPVNRSNWSTLRIANGGQQICLDVSAGGGAGTRVIPWTCHQDANQRWEIIADATVPGEFQLRPKNVNALNTRLALGAGNGLRVEAPNASAAQRWRIERITGATYQVVSAASGQCLTLATVSQDVQLVTAPCGPATRTTQVVTITREPLTFANGATVQFGVTAVPGTTYALQLRTGAATWTTLGTGTGVTLGVTRTNAGFPLNTTSEYRIVVNGTGTVVYGGILLQRDGGNVITAIAGVG